MPVLVRPGQPARLDAQDDADVVQRDLGEEALEAEPPLGGLGAESLILVDDDDAILRPSQGRGPAAEVVLQRGRLAMLEDLLRAGLAHVDDRRPIEVPRPDLARPPGRVIGRLAPPRRTHEVGPRGRLIGGDGADK